MAGHRPPMQLDVVMPMAQLDAIITKVASIDAEQPVQLAAGVALRPRDELAQQPHPPSEARNQRRETVRRLRNEEQLYAAAAGAARRQQLQLEKQELMQVAAVEAALEGEVPRGHILLAQLPRRRHRRRRRPPARSSLLRQLLLDLSVLLGLPEPCIGGVVLEKFGPVGRRQFRL